MLALQSETAPRLGASARSVEHLVELASIFDDGVNVVTHPRADNAEIRRFLLAAHAANALASARVVFEPGSTAPADALRLPALPGRAAAAADLGFLTDLYTDLLGCARIGVRLEVLRSAMCPRFHADRVGIRMSCTWMGPGTEWADERVVDRARAGGNELGPVFDLSGTCRADAFDLVLLKGEAWPGNQGRGAIHRSPDPGEDAPVRVALIFDALW